MIVTVEVSGEVVISSLIVPSPWVSSKVTPLEILVKLIRNVSGFSAYTSSVIGTSIVVVLLPAVMLPEPLTVV